MTLDQRLAVNFKLNTLIDTINQLTITELQDFAEYILETFYDVEDEIDFVTSFEVKSMIYDILENCEEEEVLDIINLLLDDLSYPAELDESVSRRMLPSHLNHKRRKFMKKSKATLRREKVKRMRFNRKNRVKRKKYYRINKSKIKAYQKSRRAMIKKGRHIVKLRRRS